MFKISNEKFIKLSAFSARVLSIGCILMGFVIVVFQYQIFRLGDIWQQDQTLGFSILANSFFLVLLVLLISSTLYGYHKLAEEYLKDKKQTK